ncbi:ATP-binding protein [Archaeoglobus profundus]|uniref:AAA domain-containing protein n=1 Tax=Archaeoglobus profundus (strain DSM 5631 / JCM 9629 / NBRC 100127 / Av18) TaxID=572546 RepID=D2RDM3_ARCPA|nr:ATPase [Archaeoglobus profundus]ADB58217.1 hypothetical protein Arcpr_1162 [Archaeoglobus profundus DSM 5631]
MAIIPRRELEDALKDYKWLLIYGRRKTGKTFYVRERAKYDRYFITTRNKTLVDVDKGEEFTQREFQKILPLLIREERIVIDEFHRLDEPIFSTLQALSGRGRIILITSTMHYFRNLIKSPLLGLLELKEVGLVDPRDAIAFAHRLGLRGKDLLEVACIVREPWLAQKVERYRRKVIEHIKEELKVYVPYLIGEVFTEEDVELTTRYSAILSSIANGKVYSSEISSYLFSRGLIDKDNPGLISQYLRNLIQMGLIKAIPVEGRRRKAFQYRHVSPITDFAYYLNEKYGFFEADIDENRVKMIFAERIPKYMEWFFEDFLVKIFGLQPVKIAKPELEVDIALREYKRIKVVAEVKWKKNIDEKELRSIEEKLSKFNARRILIVPCKDSLKRFPEDVEVWDWSDFLEMLK